MPQTPDRPKLYHIVHVDKLASIIADGCLWCDKVMAGRAPAGTTIGVGGIKSRRLSLSVECHPGDKVGDFVPFYFCPRSIMLYVIHCANHPELTYREGQEPIVHLEADLYEVVAWATANARRWAFSLSNAGAVYTQFRARIDQLEELNWPAIAATDFRPPEVKEGKQAEFLLHHSFPWTLVRRIGVASQTIAQKAANIMGGAAHRPMIEIQRGWYY